MDTFSSQSSDHSQPHIHCCSTQLLFDKVTKSLVGVDDWIAQELERISHNTYPRNCNNYEALLYVIEGHYQTESYSYPVNDESSMTKLNDDTDKRGNSQLTQKNLILAFSELIQYCQQESPQFYLFQHRQPLELLMELEKMCDMNADIQTSQRRLSCILFGQNIPIINKLVSAWTIICLWARQDIVSIPQQEKWNIFGVYSYQIAKKACGIQSKQ
ncbi:hypothetical protein INT47_012289 [Mucor saturninus]|uniref:Uncharacterized protein n=1 Tax=Mucor saturninus TaxID=64648 RepID=A0A8H7R9U3_9FUNG|nr:hypothetical protein INT47_012289 [Mucor saturninus]